MCTVTYLPLSNNDFILTSNRDETPLRKTLAPQTYEEDNVQLTYPKDKIAGGTWVGKSSLQRVVCLLNGGFVNHKRELPYKMSRGLIVKNILKAANAVQYILAYDFANIEPFTLILIDWNTNLKTYELVWDGKEKHFKELPQQPKIWSSSPLYNQEMKKQRETWFQNWLAENPNYSREDILAFHNNDQLGSPKIALKMKRSFVETVSITSIVKKGTHADLKYLSLR